MKTLYLGLTAPASTPEREVIHCPLIQLIPRQGEEVLSTLAALGAYTHLLFTSKSAVRFFFELSPPPSILPIYSLGKATTAQLKQIGITPHRTASEESSEGVIELLKQESLKNAHLLWPRSALSRPVIARYLKEKGVTLTECILYDTLPLRPEPLPQLETYDEIFFTSPSTVEAFFSLFQKVPSHLKLASIGPVTASALQGYMERPSFFS